MNCELYGRFLGFVGSSRDVTKFRVREATKGYFTDLNATRRHGGKTWIAPKTMIREDVSLSDLFVVAPLTDVPRKLFTSPT